MAKYSVAFKREVVEACIQHGPRKTETRYGVNHKQVMRWVSLYRQFGAEGLEGGQRRYSPELKLQVLQHMERDRLSAAEVAGIYGVRGTTTILVWQRRYNQGGGIEAFEPKPKGRRPTMTRPSEPPPLPSTPDQTASPEQLLKEVAYLRAEVAYLKKLEALVQAKQQKTLPKKHG